MQHSENKLVKVTKHTVSRDGLLLVGNDVRLWSVDAQQYRSVLTASMCRRSKFIGLQLLSGFETLLVQHQRVGFQLNVSVDTIQLLLETIEGMSVR